MTSTPLCSGGFLDFPCDSILRAFLLTPPFQALSFHCCRVGCNPISVLNYASAGRLDSAIPMRHCSLHLDILTGPDTSEAWCRINSIVSQSLSGFVVMQPEASSCLLCQDGMS